jgi:hypothetical protein
MQAFLDPLKACGRRITAMSPAAILAIGWLGIVLYAHPGYMSYDSVYQLLEARAGVFSDGHPPAMAALWKVVDLVIAGPFGMLVIQTTCFVLGAYLVLARHMRPRRAALGAVAIVWFPAISSTLAVIWKDSQMAGFLMLGTGLLVAPRRRTRLCGLALLAVATMMRHNALTMTFSIVGLLFVWDETHRWWKRYPLAIAAWVAITLFAQLTNGALTSDERHLWHRSLALLDIVGTLRNTPPVPEAELQPILAGTPVRSPGDVSAQAHAPSAEPSPIDELWAVTNQVFRQPDTAAERAAVSRAWRDVVFGHPRGYLAYRWGVFTQLLGLSHPDPGSVVYVWFADVQDPATSARSVDHDATPSELQEALQVQMRRWGRGWMFRPYLYLVLSLLLLPLSLRYREAAAILLSGIGSEAALFFLTPTTDFRYSFGLVVTTAFGLVMLFADRYRRAGVETSL